VLPTEAGPIYRIANAKAGISHLDTFQMLLQKFAENRDMKKSAAAALENMQGYVSGSGADTSVFDKLSISVNRLRKIPSEPPMR